MTSYKFYKVPFATAGDKTDIPNDAQVDGSVSYEEGYPINYSLNRKTNPAARLLERLKFNQALYDLTLGLQQYQAIGTPEFIDSAANGGSPYSYDAGAFALYDDGVHGVRAYQSLANANTALPSDNSKWRLYDFGANKLLIEQAVFETGGSAVVDGDVVYYNAGSSFYSQAVADGTVKQKAIGIADVVDKRINTNGAVFIGGLTAGATYYLSPTTPGSVTSTKPSANAVKIGVAISTDLLFVDIDEQSVDTLFASVSFNTSSYQTLVGGGGAQKVQFDYVESDIFGIWDDTNKRFAPGKTGRFRITGTLFNKAPDTTVIFSVYKNGALYKRLDETPGGSDETLTGSFSALATSSSDYFELFAAKAGGADCRIGNDTPVSDGRVLSTFQIEYEGEL